MLRAPGRREAHPRTNSDSEQPKAVAGRALRGQYDSEFLPALPTRFGHIVLTQWKPNSIRVTVEMPTPFQPFTYT